MVEQITGAERVAQALRHLGITTIFGLTGYPIASVAEEAINLGIRFIGFRNEQAASYAASVYGYLTGKPGCCLVVGGPGVVHAMAGVVNSSGNCFPMLLLAGSTETFLITRGGFQEIDALSLLNPHINTGIRWTSPTDALYPIAQAYRLSLFGRPGTGFVDLPADLLQSKSEDNASTNQPLLLPPPPLPAADSAKVFKIAQVVQSAKAPLVLIGKGCAYARAETNLRHLIGVTKLPFLPSPMGKGVVPDSHPCNVSSARAMALENADVILVLGARLNWIFHFGAPPKYGRNARIIQVDIDAASIGQNFGNPELGIVADVNLFAQQLVSELRQWYYSSDTEYWKVLRNEMATNEADTTKLEEIQIQPLKLENAFKLMRTTLDKLSPPVDGGIVYVSEGARTMDTSRSSFYHEQPRLRLDAGTHGTMGIGMGYAIAAWQAYNAPNPEAQSGRRDKKKIVCIMGDSAFGFSGMEVETMARFGMDVLIFVMNNNGIYQGHADTEDEWRTQQSATIRGDGTAGFRSYSLGWQTRYDQWADAVGGKGYLVRTADDLVKATEAGFKAKVPVIVNVLMESGKGTVTVFGFQVPAPKQESASAKL